MFNTQDAAQKINELAGELKAAPDQSWRETLHTRWADFRDAQIAGLRTEAYDFLAMAEPPPGADLGKIHGYARERLLRLDQMAADIGAIRNGERQIADPYFCESVLRTYAQAKGAGGS